MSSNNRPKPSYQPTRPPHVRATSMGYPNNQSNNPPNNPPPAQATTPSHHLTSSQSNNQLNNQVVNQPNGMTPTSASRAFYKAAPPPSINRRSTAPPVNRSVNQAMNPTHNQALPHSISVPAVPVSQSNNPSYTSSVTPSGSQSNAYTPRAPSRQAQYDNQANYQSNSQQPNIQSNSQTNNYSQNQSQYYNQPTPQSVNSSSPVHFDHHDDTGTRRRAHHQRSQSTHQSSHNDQSVPCSPNTLSYYVDLDGVNATIVSPALGPASYNQSSTHSNQSHYHSNQSNYQSSDIRRKNQRSVEDGMLPNGRMSGGMLHNPKQSVFQTINQSVKNIFSLFKSKDSKKNEDSEDYHRKRARLSGNQSNNQSLNPSKKRPTRRLLSSVLMVFCVGLVVLLNPFGFGGSLNQMNNLVKYFSSVESINPSTDHPVSQYSGTAPFTIISMLHDMTDEYRETHRAAYIFQLNAVKSWLRQVTAYNIILYMDTVAACTAFIDLDPAFKKIRCQPVPCSNEEFGRPRLDCLFNHANEHATTDLIAFVNGDIVLDPYLTTLLENVRRQYDQHFALVSRRTDTLMNDDVVNDMYKDLHADHTDRILQIAAESGKLHSEFGIDLFCYTRTLFAEVVDFPPFLAGVYRWDNWLLSTLILRDEITVIDATPSQAVNPTLNRTINLVVHQQNETHGVQHNKRVGNAYNDRLVKQTIGDRYKIGHINNANALISGICPDCSFVDNRNQHLHVAMFKFANPSSFITVVPIESISELDDAYSHHCYYQKLDIRHYIFLARSPSIYSSLHRAGLPVVIPAATMNNASVSDSDWALIKHDWLLDVMKLNFHLLIVDAGSLLLTDPLDHLVDGPYYDVMLKKQSTGKVINNKEFASSIVVVRSSTMGQYYWKQVRDCMVATPTVDCLSLKYTKLGGQLVKGVLDNFLYPDLGLALIDKWSQLNGHYPRVLVNNATMAPSYRRDLLKQWKLSGSVDPDTKKCIIVQPPKLSPPTKEKSTDFTLKIRVLTFDRSDSLSRLLTSLNSADYEGDSNILLEIAIDKPTNMSDTETLDKVATTASVARAFEWKHGVATVLQQETHKGLVGQWTTGWYPASDTEILLVLEDDTAVAPTYYKWVKRMILAYYLDPAAYDPSMYGFALQLQHTILGETLKERYGSRKVHDLVNAAANPALNQTVSHLFRYQLVGTWGGVFFPQHWKVFLTWLREKQFVPSLGVSQLQPPFTPCVPGVLSNEWWAAKSHKVWSQWFIRFAYENGWYNVYTNFPADPLLSSTQYDSNQTSLVANFREAGDNFNRTKGMMNPMVQTLTDDMLATPPLNTLPLFDFHFHRIYNPHQLALRNAIYDESQVDRCWTMKAFITAKKEREALEAAADEKKKLKEENKRRMAMGLKPVGSFKELQPKVPKVPKTASTTASGTAKKPAAAGGTGTKKPAAKPKAKAKPAAPAAPAAPTPAAEPVAAPAAEPVVEPVAEPVAAEPAAEPVAEEQAAEAPQAE